MTSHLLGACQVVFDVCCSGDIGPPEMASRLSPFTAVSSISGWGVDSGDGHSAYSQIAALLLTEGQQPPPLSACDKLSVTLV